MTPTDQINQMRRTAKNLVSLLDDPEFGLTSWWAMLDANMSKLNFFYTAETSENDTPENKNKPT